MTLDETSYQDKLLGLVSVENILDAIILSPPAGLQHGFLSTL